MQCNAASGKRCSGKYGNTYINAVIAVIVLALAAAQGLHLLQRSCWRQLTAAPRRAADLMNRTTPHRELPRCRRLQRLKQ